MLVEVSEALDRDVVELCHDEKALATTELVQPADSSQMEEAGTVAPAGKAEAYAVLVLRGSKVGGRRRSGRCSRA
jgi:hypothetical protein